MANMVNNAFHPMQRSRGNNETPLANLRQSLEEARLRSGIPGMSVAILHKGKLIFAEGFGRRNDYDPVTPETLMPIGSMTKAFTAAAIGELVGEGVIDWDTTPVSKYLPEFELHNPTYTSQLTFQDLLSHRTGFPPTDLAFFWNTESRRDLIKRLKSVKSGTKLTSYVIYNNVMYGVAGEAAGNVVGLSYEDVVRERVIKPLGLNNTGFNVDEMSQFPNYASPYAAASFKDAQSGKFTHLPLEDLVGPCAAAGSMYSNVLDAVRWGQAVMHYGEQDGKQVLNKDSLTEILSGQAIYNKERMTSDFGPITAYGMGWMLDSYKGNIVYQHDGHVPGFISNLMLFPDSELVIAHIANLDLGALPIYSGYHIADEILGLPKTQDWIENAVNTTRDMFDVYAAIAEGNFPKRIKNKPPTHELSELAGVYSNPLYGELHIRLEKGDEGKEELCINLRVFEGKLEHYHYDSFKVVLRHSSLSFAQLVTFATGPDGEISGFQIELLDRVQEFKKE
ncbi:hypothetical protein BGX26_010038 [Mortierella sp. AD094]|nr:hypothetical protein BGX26_010038 [Mortierella sp. AD094]